MLQLKNIVKSYGEGENRVEVLKSIDLEFAKNEFVSILGASGSGKTTLLNIIGGLDTYSSGEMTINGISTVKFKDRDWDSYRNGAIGFVFQNYNLISHLSVLENVKMALSISGISHGEREDRAIKALTEVGLKEHMSKKPNQLSGGQMQRVAIARALVTNPKIILADEPTGALDSKTSRQIMELIKNISRDKIVIMVTHNPQIATQYSDRIIRLSDGEVIEDSRLNEKSNNHATYKPQKTSMPFAQAIGSSLKNLMTKKVRTTITSVAASIGIISIGLVLAISAGMRGYIDKMQASTLTDIPISISQNQMVLEMKRMSEQNNEEKTESPKEIGVAKTNSAHRNIFDEKAVLDKTFLQYLESKIDKSNMGYESGYELKVFRLDEAGYPKRVESTFSTINEHTLSQYDVLAGKAPSSSNEIALFVDENGMLDEEALKTLGFETSKNISFDKVLGKQFTILTNDVYYERIGDKFIQRELEKSHVERGRTLTISAVLKPKSRAAAFNSAIGYTSKLGDELLEEEKNSEIIVAQRNSKDKGVIFGSGSIDESTYALFMQKLGGSSTPAGIYIYPKSFKDRDNVSAYIDEYNNKIAEKFGKDTENYNKYRIAYMDMSKNIVGIMDDMISTITVILTAFSAISLIVSSVMIGILTYVSVVERTKEIGIMRAIGARKKDISRIFNAEAGILGFLSGAMGVAVAMILTVPINKALASSFNIDGFSAHLSAGNGALLIIISVVLTLIAGFLPSKIAARKRPVDALRSE